LHILFLSFILSLLLSCSLFLSLILSLGIFVFSVCLSLYFPLILIHSFCLSHSVALSFISTSHSFSLSLSLPLAQEAGT
jgi:hypothetical protein